MTLVVSPNRRLVLDDKTFEAGEQVSVDEARAKHLLAEGAIEEKAPSSTPTPTPTPTPSAPSRPGPPTTEEAD